jgi:hypothetical protein
VRSGREESVSLSELEESRRLRFAGQGMVGCEESEEFILVE